MAKQRQRVCLAFFAIQDFKYLVRVWIDSSVRTSVQVPEPRRLLGPIAITIGSNIYGGRVSTIVVALIVGVLGGFLSFKGYVRRA